MTALYEYYPDSRLMRSYNTDSSGRLLSESIYKYDTLQIITKVYYSKDSSMIESIEYFDKPNVIQSFVDKHYDRNGHIVATGTSTYKNKYNGKGQLIKSKFRKDDISCVKFYNYYDNGLIKSKTDDICLFNWRIVYEFY